MSETEDTRYAREALEIALEGVGQASPNPLVGTVIVRDREVVGRGAHRYANRKHAEVVALEDAGDRARGATVYVNLEPCSHHGRTPPCVDALVDAGVARVVASMRDPAPYVDGRGFELLRQAGIDVAVGAERQAAERLNERYLKIIATGRPFVTLKLAETLDGRAATRTGSSKWITGVEARVASQAMRRADDAILVGVNTILADDPDLTYRGEAPKRTPIVRAVIDSHLRTPLGSRLVSSASSSPAIIFTSERSIEEAGPFRDLGVEVVSLPASPSGGLDLGSLLDELGSRKLHGLIVEGGPETSASFLDAGLVDKVVAFVAPKLMGGRSSIGAIGGDGPDDVDGAVDLTDVRVRRLGSDIEIVGYPKRR